MCLYLSPFLSLFSLYVQNSSWVTRAKTEALVACFFPLLLVIVAIPMGLCLHALHDRAAVKQHNEEETLELQQDAYRNPLENTPEIGTKP